MQPSTTSGPARTVFPLYAKILLCFLANIALVGAVAVWLLRSHFGLESDWLLTRDARQRLQALGQGLMRDLAETPRPDWDTVINRLGTAHGLTFGLFDPAGHRLAGGEGLVLPEAVQRRLAVEMGRRPFDGPQGREGPPPGPPEDARFRDGNGRPGRLPADRTDGAGRPRPFTPGGPDRAGPGPGRAPGSAMGGGFPSEALSTNNPRAYWLIVRLPPPPDERPLTGAPRTQTGLGTSGDGPDGRPRTRPPMTLVGMTSALGQSGLLFDPAPWLWAGAGTLGLSALLWWPLVRGLTRSLGQMTKATEAIAQGRFDTRVEATRRDELGSLGRAVNRMTERLDGFVTGQKRFLGDIAHELVSPLARMEMALGILEMQTPPELHPRLGDVRDEVREMSALVNELLSFTKAGLQAAAAAREPVDLAPLVHAVAAREAAAGAAVKIDIAAGLRVLAVPPLLRRAVANVLRNAAQHALPTDATGGTTAIEIAASAPDPDGRVHLTLADHGPGVPPAALPKLFDPFFRLDPSRTRDTGGVGLGLAIVKTCVEACGGTVTARNRDGGGLVVEFSLPVACAGGIQLDGSRD